LEHDKATKGEFMNAFQAGQLVAYVRSIDENPEHIAAICNALEEEFTAEPVKKERKKSSHEWSPEQRQAAADRLRARQAAKKEKED